MRYHQAPLGPYFAVAHGTPPRGRVSVADALAGDVLTARIAHVGRSLGCSERVAASLAHQGLAALLVSPPLALAALHGVVPGWTADSLHWVPADTGTWEQWCDPAAVDLRAGTVDECATRLGATVVDGLLGPLAAAVRARVRVSEQVLRGNAASAFAAAAGIVARARPDAADRVGVLVRSVLATGPLAGTGEVGPTGFRRRSCCLYHRVPGGGICGDCVLRR